MRQICHDGETKNHKNYHVVFVRHTQEIIEISLDQDAQIEEKIETPGLKTQKAYGICHPSKMGKISVIICIIEIG